MIDDEIQAGWFSVSLLSGHLDWLYILIMLLPDEEEYGKM